MPESHNQVSTTQGNGRHTLKSINNDGYKETLYLLASAGTPLSVVIERVKQDYVAAALRCEGWVEYKAAARIDVHRNTISRNKPTEGER